MSAHAPMRSVSSITQANSQTHVTAGADSAVSEHGSEAASAQVGSYADLMTQNSHVRAAALRYCTGETDDGTRQLSMQPSSQAVSSPSITGADKPAPSHMRTWTQQRNQGSRSSDADSESELELAMTGSEIIGEAGAVEVNTRASAQAARSRSGSARRSGRKRKEIDFLCPVTIRAVHERLDWFSAVDTALPFDLASMPTMPAPSLAAAPSRLAPPTPKSTRGSRRMGSFQKAAADGSLTSNTSFLRAQTGWQSTRQPDAADASFSSTATSLRAGTGVKTTRQLRQKGLVDEGSVHVEFEASEVPKSALQTPAARAPSAPAQHVSTPASAGKRGGWGKLFRKGKK